MYALIIGRAYPESKSGMIGIFEYEQAKAINNHDFKTVYSFCDTRSIKRLKKYGPINFENNNISIYGYNIPIGGIPNKIHGKIKTFHYDKVLNKIVKEKGVPDIIHVHFPLLTLNKEIWRNLKSLNRPLVITEHWTKVQIKELSSLQLELLKKIEKEADAFICVGDILRNSVIELTNTSKDIIVVPNMVNSAFYYEKKSEEDNIFKFISIGRLETVKRFDLVIEAFAKLFKNNNEVYLHIVGSGPLNEAIRLRIKELGMESRIIMHGLLSREETAEKVRESDAFVSGSILETFGVPFIEAMACGKPVIGIKDGPIDRYINSSNGILFDQDNIESLIEAMEIMYKNRGTYNAEIISKTASNLFSEEAVVKQIIGVFNKSIKIYN